MKRQIVCNHTKIVSCLFLFAGIISGVLFGASPANAQSQSPFDDKKVNILSTVGASGSSALIASRTFEGILTAEEGVSNRDASAVSALVGSSTYDGILTDEERELMALKLLPTYYPFLKDAMKGIFGSLARAKSRARGLFKYPNAVYSQGFGEPPKMLEWARRYRSDAAMVKICSSTQRGDIILTGHASAEGQKNDMIAVLTGGKYYHAVTVIDGPPCVFIEAVGVTGDKSDPSNGCVRISCWYEQLASWETIRLLRPTAGLPPDEAKKYIDGAVKYLTAQLGKPYDYGFTNNDTNRAFYCSELAWKCYYEGGGMKSYKPAKSSERDRMIVALNAVVDGLEPKDRIGLANRVVAFTNEYTSQKPPDLQKLNNFIVDELAPSCEVFSDAFPTPAAREKLRGVLGKVCTNQAFTGFIDAQKAYKTAEKSGDFKAGWGIGTARKVVAEAKIAGSIAGDINSLVKESGAGYVKLAKLIGSVIAPLYKYMGTYADFLTGMDKDGKLAIPEGAKTILSMTEWLANKRESIKKWPVGSSLANLLPGNGDEKVQGSFTSPTDLADTSPNFHLDYP
ncbi:MAG: YiiX/YebB-like N1pC/P60 family cysteine hydrolase [Candidatus Ozemobacteraceae bacterium]